MIAGATRGSGGRALAAHLANEAKNERVEPGESRGLVSDPTDTHAQMRELQELAAHGRTDRPIHHVHCDPPPGCADEAAVRNTFWRHYEREFSLENQPFFSRIHEKEGRTHEHRVYSLVRAEDGSVIDLSHDYARREKVSRVTEAEHGLEMVAGKHNRAAAAALEREGRMDVAQAMRHAGLLDRERPVAPVTPQERAQAERSAVSKLDVRAGALAAWRAADDGRAFEAALAEKGLRLAQGDSTPQLVDATGNTHDLRRTLAQAAKAEGGEKITAAAVRGRLDGLALPPVDQARQAIADRPDAVPAQQNPATPEASPTAESLPDSVDKTAPATPVASFPSVAEQAPTPPVSVDTPQPAPVQAPSVGADHSSALKSSGGGAPAAAAADSGGADFVLAYDPNKPGDLERYMRDWVAYWNRVNQRAQKAADEARKSAGGLSNPQHGAHPHADHYSPFSDPQFIEVIRRACEQVRERADEIRAAVREAEAAHLDGQHGRGAPQRNDGGRADPSAPEFHGQQGHEPGRVRSAESGEGLGRPDGAVGAPGETRRRGEGAARPDPHAPGADRREPDPDRAAHGRHRVQARRAARGLAHAAAGRADRLAALSAALAPPEERIRAALAESDQRTRQVLAGEPWKDSASRDTRLIAANMHEARMAQAKARDQAAEHARAAADAARARVGPFDRLAGALGIRTGAVREAAEAESRALDAEAARDDGRDLRAELATYDRRATAIVRGREGERDRWRQRPDVARAARERHGNELVKRAIAGGDKRIQAIAGRDLAAAREMLIKAEEEARRQQQAATVLRAVQKAASWKGDICGGLGCPAAPMAG